MKILQARFEYVWDQDENEVKTKLQSRVDLFRTLKIKLPEDDEKARSTVQHSEIILSDEQLMQCILGGQLPREVKELARFGEENMLLDAIQRLTEKFDRLAKLPGESDEHLNEYTRSHVPNALLVNYNQVMLMEDACTDALQGTLNDGWRIIAVCPQAQRRPDYVLARFNVDLLQCDMHQLPDRAFRR